MEEIREKEVIEAASNSRRRKETAENRMTLGRNRQNYPSMIQIQLDWNRQNFKRNFISASCAGKTSQSSILPFCKLPFPFSITLISRNRLHRPQSIKMPDAAQINRSISTIRTELEFLQASNVLSGPQFQSILAQLPVRYSFHPKSDFVHAELILHSKMVHRVNT